MKRLKIAAGNWKMNTSPAEAVALATTLAQEILTDKDTLMILAPPFVHLNAVQEQIQKSEGIYLAAQNCHEEKKGAYTGEIAATMLAAVGCKYIIVGHSERRQYFAESDSLIGKKINAVLAENMYPILCVGEPLEVREADKQEELVKTQLENGLFHLSETDVRKVVIAYEPVWAIGTGKTASPEQAQDMHAFIRQLLQKKYGKEIADLIPILYGGSCNAANADAIFAKPDVDGGLIGGASLKAADFIAIYEALKRS